MVYLSGGLKKQSEGAERDKGGETPVEKCYWAALHWGKGACPLVSYEEAGRVHLRIAFPRTGLDTDPLTPLLHWLAATSEDVKIPDSELPLALEKH